MSIKLTIREFTPSVRFGTASELARVVEATAGQERSPTPFVQFFDTPLCFVLKDGSVHAEACLFLAHVSLHSRSHNAETVRTYAKSLLPWLKYIAELSLTVQEVTESHFATYRAHLVRQTKWSSSTINLRIQVLSYFHFWAQTSGTATSPFGQYLQKRAEKSTPDWRRRLAPFVEHKEPRYLGLDDWLKIRSAAIDPWRLMFTWSICTGLRRWEICNLRLEDLDELINSIDGESIVAKTSIVRKGGRRTTIYVPIKLIRETVWWRDFHRPPNAGDKPTDTLFASLRGKPIAPNYFSRCFRQTANNIGTTATLHHLRHAFAMMILDWLPELASEERLINPMKLVQDLLGHASQESSERYIRASRGYEEGMIAYLGERLDGDEL